jgi:fucose 4-O-acetylase-like acetyltransferase
MNEEADIVRTPTDWIVIAKGIGIILVVVGHFHPDTAPDYWPILRSLIYSFHMPLFFMLSGFLYVHRKYSYRALVANKARRLLYPFATIAVGYCLIKLLLSPFLRLSFPVDARTLFAVVADPVNSYAPMLWFLQALFLIFCVYPPLRSVLGAVWLLVAVVLLNEVLGNRYLFFGKALANMPFFALGVVLRERAAWSAALRGGGSLKLVAALCAFTAGCIAQLWAGPGVTRDYVFQWVLGVVGAVFVSNLSAAIADHAKSRVRTALMLTGYYSMTIYFFHSLFESAVTIGYYKVARRISVPFELVALAAVAAGIVFPILLERLVVRKWWVTRRFVLGLD